MMMNLLALAGLAALIAMPAVASWILGDRNGAQRMRLMIEGMPDLQLDRSTGERFWLDDAPALRDAATAKQHASRPELASADENAPEANAPGAKTAKDPIERYADVDEALDAAIKRREARLLWEDERATVDPLSAQVLAQYRQSIDRMISSSDAAERETDADTREELIAVTRAAPAPARPSRPVEALRVAAASNRELVVRRAG